MVDALLKMDGEILLFIQDHIDVYKRQAVWKGYEAMVKNDGSQTNREAFWSYIDPCLPVSRKESEALADAFYDGEFNRAVSATQPTELSDAVVKLARCV